MISLTYFFKSRQQLPAIHKQKRVSARVSSSVLEMRGSPGQGAASDARDHGGPRRLSCPAVSTGAARSAARGGREWQALRLHHQPASDMSRHRRATPTGHLGLNLGAARQRMQ